MAGAAAVGAGLAPEGAKAVLPEVNKELEPDTWYGIYVTAEGTLFLLPHRPEPEAKAYRCGSIKTKDDGKVACFHQTVMDDYLTRAIKNLPDE